MERPHVPLLWTELRRLGDQLLGQGLPLTFLAAWDKFGRKLTGKPIWRFSWITPQILLGGQPARRLLLQLKILGVTGVINLREEYDYAAEVGPGNFDYLYLPTKDNTAPSIEHLNRGVAFMREHLEKNGSVYIHCWEGLGRSPTMLAAYFVSTGLTPQAAWEKIRQVRPFIRPNSLQIKQIEQFALQAPKPLEPPLAPEEK
jgi:protein-tyrosine phosphatase